MKKQGPKIETRLTAETHRRFSDLVKERNITSAELGREAILFYLDHHQTQREDLRESKIEKRLKAIEDRYAGLLVRVGIDVGTLMALMSSRIPAAERTQTMDKCYQVAVKHFNKKLDGVARDMKQALSKGDSVKSEEKQ